MTGNEEEQYGRLDPSPADEVVIFEDMVIIKHGMGQSTKVSKEEWVEYHSEAICEWE